MERSADWHLLELISELQRLADPELAEAHLRTLGTWDCLDELTLEFDYSFTYLRRANELSAAQLQALSALDDALDQMSNARKPALWFGAEALARPEWKYVRALALNAISRCNSAGTDDH